MGAPTVAGVSRSSGARLSLLLLLLLVLSSPAQPTVSSSQEEVVEGGSEAIPKVPLGDAAGTSERVEGGNGVDGSDQVERAVTGSGTDTVQDSGSEADGSWRVEVDTQGHTGDVDLQKEGSEVVEKVDGGELEAVRMPGAEGSAAEGTLGTTTDEIAADLPCDAMVCTCLSNGELSLIRMDLTEQCSAFDVFEPDLPPHLTPPAPHMRTAPRTPKPKTVIRQLPDPDEYIQAEREEAKRREQALLQEGVYLRHKVGSEGGHQQQYGDVEEGAGGVQVVQGVGVEELRLEQDMENMASKKMGAKVLAANVGATRLSEILRDDPDTYLKNECSTKEGQWIVIELPQIVKVEAITVSVTEMYSARVKTIQVLSREARMHGDAQEIAATRTGPEWHPLAELVAENRRGTHAFRLPWERWAKYLQFRFESHYGNQKVCAINEIQVFGLTKAEEIMKELEAVGGPSHVPPPLHAEVVVPHSPSEPPLNSEQGSSVPSEEKPEAEVVEVGTEAGDGRQGVEQHQQQQQQSGTSGVGEDGRANAGEEGNQTDKASDWGEGSGHGDAAQADRTSEPSHGGDGSNAAGTVRYLVASGEEEDSALPRGQKEVDDSVVEDTGGEAAEGNAQSGGSASTGAEDGTAINVEEATGDVENDSSSPVPPSAQGSPPPSTTGAAASDTSLSPSPASPPPPQPKAGTAAGDGSVVGEQRGAATTDLPGPAAAAVVTASAAVPRTNSSSTSDLSSAAAAAAAASHPRLEQLADYAATGMRGLAGSSAIIDMFLQELKMLKLDNVYNKKYMKDAIANITFAFMEHDEQVEEVSAEIDALRESCQTLDSSVDSQVKQLLAEGKRLTKSLSHAQSEISALQAVLKASQRQQQLLLVAVCVLLVLRGGWHQAPMSPATNGGASSNRKSKPSSRAAAGLWGLLGWTGRAAGCAWAGLLAICWSCAGRVSYEEIGNCVMKRFNGIHTIA